MNANRGVWDEDELLGRMGAVLVHRVGVLFDQVPLIDDDDDALFLLLDVSGDVQILRGEGLGGVDHHEDHIGSVDGAHRPYHAVVLDAGFHATATANAGSVDERDRSSIPFEMRVERVARGAGNVADDCAFLTEQRIDKPALAHVWTADDRNGRTLELPSSSSECGSASTMASSKSPVPVPCNAESAIGSPSPSS